MKHWKTDESVDGSGLNVEQHANALADALMLTDSQRVVLCHELGNVLIPAITNAERHGATLAAKQLERLLCLQHAIVLKGNHS